MNNQSDIRAVVVYSFSVLIYNYNYAIDTFIYLF